MVDMLREGPLGTGNKGRVAEALCHKAEELQVGWHGQPVDLAASMQGCRIPAGCCQPLTTTSAFCPPPSPDCRPPRW